MSSLNHAAPAPEAPYASGLRVEIRDAEWVIKRADLTPNGTYSLLVTGISELVRGRDARFLTEIDQINPLHPEETKLVPDESPQFARSRLYLESLLRQSPPTSADLFIGHKAAIDSLPYQLDPALQALAQIRHRILLADAVGLGKTIEVGILLAELIRRGKGRRILVVTPKSMMTQFQSELWCRFTIPLVRLDSTGIDAIRRDIPSDANPFNHYDKTIISIDTLKREKKFFYHLERSYWDIIVIDEAQNVALRGSESERAALAQLLAKQSDTLILASATPHDGRPESFASLMNMLNPTAIADRRNYGKEDIEGLFLRRFKKDVAEQAGKAFLDRRTTRFHVSASAAEETAYDLLTQTKFRSFDKIERSGQMLFRTLLEKSLFSSPAACAKTIETRLAKLAGSHSPEADHDRTILASLKQAVDSITPKQFSKYLELVKLLEPGGKLDWHPDRSNDRLVIFTERVESLRFLRDRLKADLDLEPNQIATLYGQESDDKKLQETVRNFGLDDQPIRVLIATDIAAEGINLHTLAHKLIHFDIPWSLMVFQQRNGRIDRYGQEQHPHIAYLCTEAANTDIHGDLRILELLTEKDERAQKNIDDPSVFLGVEDQAEQELKIAKAIEAKVTPDIFKRQMEGGAAALDFLALLRGNAPVANGSQTSMKKKNFPSLFVNDLTYFETATEMLNENGNTATLDRDRQMISFDAPKDLERLLKRVTPKGSFPSDGRLHLTINRKLVLRNLDQTRKGQFAGQVWPQIQLLWDLHPVVEWLNYKLLVAFNRGEAPVLTVSGMLTPGEIVFLMQAEIPNRKGQPVVHSWFGVRFESGAFAGIEELHDFLARTRFHAEVFPNPDVNRNVNRLTTLLPEVIQHARAHMSRCRGEINSRFTPKLAEQERKLASLRSARQQTLNTDFKEETLNKSRRRKKESEEAEIDNAFNDYTRYVRETLTTEDAAFIRVAAVFRGE
jgi:hypothetical protein